MKRFFLFILTVSLAATPCILFVTCTKTGTSASENNNSYTGKVLAPNATIIGADQRTCPCCGGYFVKIDGQTPIAGEYFLTNSFPTGYKPVSYPAKVYIEWEKDANACINDKIIIKRIIAY